MSGKRCWLKDGRCLNAEDARQVVREYRASYAPGRFAWLMRQAAEGTPYADCRAVFLAAREGT